MGYKRLLGTILLLIFCTAILVYAMCSYVEKTEDVKDEVQTVSEDEPAGIDEIIAQLEDIADAESFTTAKTDKTQPIPTEEPVPTAYLQLSSTFKDIRIKLLDEKGQRIKGILWGAGIDGPDGEELLFADEDADGVIHADSLPSGSYRVKVEAPEGYFIPPGDISIKIKDQISYTTIEDILDLVYTEDEISEVEEDTHTPDEIDEGVMHSIGQVGTFGIDVSKYNKDIDWNQVRNAGVEYAIIRCGYRGSTSGYLVIDPYFYQNFYGAKAAGVKVGIYFFSQAITPAEAIEEASMVCALLKDEEIDYPVFLDVEGSGGRGDFMDTETRTAVINTFVNTMLESGYRAGVYANKNWFTYRINTDELPDNCYKWLAQYNVSGPTYKGNYHMWQYSSKGTLPGIEGFVDLNQSYME